MNEEKKLLRIFSYFVRELIAGARKKSVTKFNDNLEDLDFFVTHFNAAQKKIEPTATNPGSAALPQRMQLLMLDEAKCGKFIAGEAHKFFLASMISLERSRQAQQHNLAWQIVEHYYAAYYSVHYLMRVVGYSLTNLDDKAVKALKRHSVVNIDEIQSGLCTLNISQDCKDVLITKNERGGGSHKDAWSIWVTILTDIINLCKSDPEEYSKLEIDLLAHKKFIAVNDKKFNPSDIRGEVNYQFKGDAWCFEEKTKTRVQLITRALSSDECDLYSESDKILRLVNNNKFIINFARMFFEYSKVEYAHGICRSIHHQYKDKINVI